MPQKAKGNLYPTLFLKKAHYNYYFVIYNTNISLQFNPKEREEAKHLIKPFPFCVSIHPKLSFFSFNIYLFFDLIYNFAFKF